MRATYGRNVMAREKLEAAGIETFIPMRKARRRRRNVAGERPKVQWVPVVRDLIFVHTERSVIQEAKQDIPFLHYIMRSKESGEREPVVVPERQMRPFIESNTPEGNDIEWIEPADLRPGERFRVLEGPFRGLEAIVQRLPGRRARSIVVQIEGLIAAAISLPIDCLERIKG